jgi:1,4-alpha-glucan branching enzyme
MLKKTYSKERKSCRVTFELPPAVDARTACVCGEFNEWDVNAHPMKRRKDGKFHTDRLA